MARWFKKELLNHPISHNGGIVRFEPVGGNVGVLQLDEQRDAALIAELDGHADRRRLGIVRINADIAEALKKNKALKLSPPALAGFQKLRIADRDLLPQKPRAALETSLAPRVAESPAPPPAPAPVVPDAAPPPAEPFKPKRAPKSKVDKAEKS